LDSGAESNSSLTASQTIRKRREKEMKQTRVLPRLVIPVLRF
jgi:hypothetical protein